MARTASRRAAVFRGKASSWDKPAPEVFSDTNNSGEPGPALANLPSDPVDFDMSSEPWFLYSGVPNAVWDMSNYPDIMPPVGKWTGAATMMNYPTF